MVKGPCLCNKRLEQNLIDTCDITLRNTTSHSILPPVGQLAGNGPRQLISHNARPLAAVRYYRTWNIPKVKQNEITPKGMKPNLMCNTVLIVHCMTGRRSVSGSTTLVSQQRLQLNPQFCHFKSLVSCCHSWLDGWNVILCDISTRITSRVSLLNPSLFTSYHLVSGASQQTLIKIKPSLQLPF
jgi:hypothetical protein